MRTNGRCSRLGSLINEIECYLDAVFGESRYVASRLARNATREMSGLGEG